MIKDLFKKILFNNKCNTKIKVDYEDDVLISTEILYHSPIIELSNIIINTENNLDNPVEKKKEETYTYNTEETVIEKSDINTTVLDYINNPKRYNVLGNTLVVIKLISNVSITNFLLDINNYDIKIKKIDKCNYIIYGSYLDIYKYLDNLPKTETLDYNNLSIYKEFNDIIKTYIIDNNKYNSIYDKIIKIINLVESVEVIDSYYLDDKVNYITFITNDYASAKLLQYTCYSFNTYYSKKFEYYIISMNQSDLYNIINNTNSMTDSFKDKLLNNINTGITNDTSNNIDNDSYYRDIDEIID